MSFFMRSISLEVVSPLLGSTVRPSLRSTTLPIPSSTRRRRRSGKASSRLLLATCWSLSLPAGSSESVMNSQYEFYHEWFAAYSSLNGGVTEPSAEEPDWVVLCAAQCSLCLC